MFLKILIEKFFEKIDYLNEYEPDGDFKSIIGSEGILPGTPLFRRI